MVNNFCMRFSWFSWFPFSGTEISFQIYWRIWGWSFSCRSKISGYSIQTTVNCLCREDFWFDSWQFEERIISAVELMYSGDCSHLVRCDVEQYMLKSVCHMSTMMNFFLVIFYFPLSCFGCLMHNLSNSFSAHGKMCLT
jgi:hypothetical protein